MDRLEILPGLSVSRETFSELQDYSAQALKWTKTINLIAPGTVDQVWDRHIKDSAQVYPFLKGATGEVLDLGSGGGFPGVVLAILAKEMDPGLHFTMVEADKRKSVFLRQCVRRFALNAEVKAARIEEVQAVGAQIVTARALAPLDQLLGLAVPHLKPGATALFLKGRNAESELEAARKSYKFNAELIASVTSEDAYLIKLEEIASV